MKECRLTTLDNPYNPFTDFDNWYQYDEEKGYHTSGYIARFFLLDEDAPEAMYREEYERVVDEINKVNVFGIYKKVYEKDYEGNNWKPIELDKIMAETTA